MSKASDYQIDGNQRLVYMAREARLKPDESSLFEDELREIRGEQDINE